MENKKTALQQLIDVLDLSIKNYENKISDSKNIGREGTEYHLYLVGKVSIFEGLRCNVNELLQIELDQMKEAYNTGRSHRDHDDFEEWFNETYEK